MRTTVILLAVSVCFAGLVAALSFLAPVASATTRQPKISDAEFFETKVKPVLVTHCFQCHGAGKKVKGKLLMDTRENWLKGGYNGPAIVPGNPDESLAVLGMLYDDPDFQMPPAGKLEEEDIQTVIEWVRRDAPWSGGPLPKPDIDPTLDDADEDEDVDRPATAEEKEFFTKRVLPILDKHCFRCHGGKRRVKGDLHLTTIDGMKRGGYTAPAVVPGKPGDSLLIEAIRYTNIDLAMPPDYKLSDLEIADLYMWIQGGAIWPEDVEAGKVSDDAGDEEK